ncbi:UNVERIFIED_CONTAM: hypothetical protein FKN15_014168, partial [Acipenser sinensis]
SGYLFGVAALASKKVSESVLETAQTIRKSVDQHPINGIIDKTILGDFKREQESFVKEQQQRKAEAAVPLWVGYSDEESMKQQILSLSLDRRNFLRDPPAGVHFQFDFSQAAPVAMVTLQEDAMLSRMRFELVPRHVKEEVFWRNYFYRVSLVRQSAQLSSLASQHTERQRDIERGSGDHTPSTEAAVPLWVGYSDEESMKQQILSLSLDRRNFLRDPPAGVHFQFDFSQAAPVAMVTLQEDAMLSRMRFELVPRHVKEEVFWRNYFYRVSLVRQSAQLSSLASQHTERQRDTERGSGDHTPSTGTCCPPAFTTLVCCVVSLPHLPLSLQLVSLDDVSVSPPSGEFISDSFNTSLSPLNQEDLLRDRQQLGMGQGEKDPAVEQEQDDIPEWERELQRELQEFEVVEPGERGAASEAWEREIEELLLEDL